MFLRRLRLEERKICSWDSKEDCHFQAKFLSAIKSVVIINREIFSIPYLTFSSTYFEGQNTGSFLIVEKVTFSLLG